MAKPRIAFAGVELAAASAVAWRFTTGTRPYLATFSVYYRDWEATLRQKIGQTSNLIITDARTKTLDIQGLTLLHEVPSSAPNLRSFVVADKRWRWQYPLISRDYNVPKKTGDRTAQVNTPFPGFVTTDEYDYKGFSLQGGTTVWTAKAALEDVLEQLKQSGQFNYSIDSFPIDEGSGAQRAFTMQNVVLRDQGDVALARILAYIPGATLWVDAAGTVRIINGADLSAAEAYFQSLPGATWDGERAVIVDRKAIRPRKVTVHYQREVEVILEYSDSFSGTIARPSRTRPYIENVIQTVDNSTTVTEFDPVTGQTVTKSNLPPGTWVEFRAWLAAMDQDRPPNSDPWTFETIKMHWLHGDLDGALGAGGKDYDDSADISMRIQAIKQHFRQSFRINRLLMDRTRDVQNVSAMLLDPYTGTRGPSRVWGQATIIPSKKGERMSLRKDPNNAYLYRVVDYFAPTQNEFSGRTIEAPHGPTRVNIVDRDLGIFRLDWVLSPYGTDQSFIPCLLEDERGRRNAPRRDLAMQDDEPMGGGVKVEGGSNSIFLANSLSYRVLLTFIPGAPNNKKAFHRVELDAADVEAFVEGDWRIGAGVGPDLEVFIPPTEATARFAWQADVAAGASVGNLFGLNEEDPTEGGIEGTEIPGFVLTNGERELASHSRAVASEIYAGFADSLQGRVTTIVPEDGLKIVGNMSGATVQAAAAPSGKVSAMHEFPGVQKPISRLALMSEGARQVVLGIVRFSGGDS